jgi:hypothetical protein
MKGSTIQTLSEYITQLHNDEKLRSQLEQPDFDTTIHTTNNDSLECEPSPRDN